MIRSPKDAFALGIGMIHQHFKLINILTAAQNIILGLQGPQKLNMKKITDDINALTNKYGFDLDPDMKIYDMSVSQKQTVEIVKVLYRGARRRHKSSSTSSAICGEPASRSLSSRISSMR